MFIDNILVMNMPMSEIGADTAVDGVIDHPGLMGFGRFVIPYPAVSDTRGMTLSSIRRLMPYHSNIRVQDCVDTVNSILSRLKDGRMEMHRFCSGRRGGETALFYFRGEKDGPAAFICAGGGMRYVASIHEGFPHAMALSDMGFNAFVVQYRTDDMSATCRDLSDAIVYAYEHRGAFGLGEDYSTWGSSAGARIAAYLGTYGPGAFTETDLPAPGCVVMAYTGHREFSPHDLPTYAVVGSLDGIANPGVVLARADSLRSHGIDAEVRVVEGIGHGFGLGTGTPAEGWLDDAVGFWRRHLRFSCRRPGTGPARTACVSPGSPRRTSRS